MLTIIALMLLVLGFWQMAVRPEGRSSAIAWLPDWFTNSVLGWSMVVLSGAALVCALTSRWWKKLALAIGFRCCMAASGSLTFLYGVAYLSGLAPGAAFAAILFLGFTAIILEVSAWENGWTRPPHAPTRPPGSD